MPDWVRQPPKSVPNIYRQVVESGPWGDRPTCEQKIEQVASDAVYAYLRQLVTEETGRTMYVPALESLGITPRYIRERIFSESEAPYYESRDFSHASDMQNLHVLLEFERADTDDLLERWREYERRGRMETVAFAMGGVLATLAGALGLIKLDTYTKGYYTKRLFIGVPAAIIGAGLLLSMLS